MPTETNLFLLIEPAPMRFRTEAPAPVRDHGAPVDSREVLGRKNPRVGLNEHRLGGSKGNELTREAYKELALAKINFIGNVRARFVLNQTGDVVVCDGFVGNVILKTSESLAGAIFFLAQARSEERPETTGRRASGQGSLLQTIRHKTNTEEYGGMPLLGVNGILHQGARQFLTQGDQECDPGPRGSRDSQG